MSQNPKISHAEATTIARGVWQKLQSFTTVFTFAGSLRRKVAQVGDIEAVVLPTLETVPDGFFGEKQIRSRDFVLTVHSLGHLQKGDPVDGRYCRIVVGGDLNVITQEVSGGVQLDLFIPHPLDYGRQLAIRTGPSNYSANVLAKKWSEMGWCGTVDGLRRKSQCDQNGKVWKLKDGLSHVQLPPAFNTELEFFQFLGLDYVKPEMRF